MANKTLEDQIKAVTELRRHYNDFLKAQDEYGKKSEEAAFYEKELLKIASERLQVKINEVEHYRVIQGHLEKTKQSQEELKEIKKQESKFNKFIRGDIESIYEVKAKEHNLEVDQLELKKVTEQISEKEYKRERERLKDKVQMYNRQIQLTNQTKLGITAATGLKSEFGGAVNAIKLMATTKGAFKAVAAGVFSVINPLNLLLNIVQGYIDRIKELDSARVSFNQQTGAIDRYKGTLESAYQSNIRYNVSLQEQARALGNLHTGMSTFSGLTRETQKDLATFTGRLQKNLGIDAVQGLETLNRTMGMSAMASKNTFESMIKEADQYNLNIQEVANGLKSNADNLAVYGSRGVTVYMELAKKAKALGMEMGKLHSMSQKFLDFEQASRMAASIAQYAGKQVLSATKLIAADGEERINMIIGAVRKLGNFEKMTAQQRLDIAQKVGVSVSDLSKMMRGEQTAAQEKREMQRNLNKILKQSITMIDNLKNAWKNLTQAVGPIVDLLRFIIGGFADFMALGGGLVGKITLIAGAFVLFTSPIGILIGVVLALYMFRDSIKDALGAIPAILENIAVGVSDFFSELGSMFLNAGEKLMRMAIKIQMLPYTILKAAMGKIIEFSGKAFGMISGLFSKFGKVFLDAGKNLMRMLGRGIKAGVMMPVNAIKSVIGKVRRFLPFSPAKEGPLMDIMEVGPNIVKYIGQGIEKNGDKVLSPMKSVVGGVSSIASVGPELLKESVKTMSTTNSSDVSNVKEIVRAGRDEKIINNKTASKTNTVNNNKSAAPLVIQFVVDSKVLRELVIDDIKEQYKLSNILSSL